MSQNPNQTIGLDVGDQFSVSCVVDRAGRLVRRGHVRTTAASGSKAREGVSDVPGLFCQRCSRPFILTAVGHLVSRRGIE